MKISVIGAGSFGTAIAQILAENVDNVYLLARNKKRAEYINRTHENKWYHPGIKLDEKIKVAIIQESDEIIEDSDYIFFAVPSGSLRSIIKSFDSHLKDKKIISCIKGIEYPSLKPMTTVIQEETDSKTVFCISGPNFADELIRGVTSGITIGAPIKYQKNIRGLLESQNIILDYSENIKGVEFCGILKNVYAVGMGILDGRITGENHRYTLLTLCFKEMKQILDEMGYVKLLDKFCGFGDFLLTALTDKSRNRTLGLMLGKKMQLSEKSTITIESLRSIKAIRTLTNNLNLPILELVHKTLETPDNISVHIKNFQENLK
ncbi:MAG TPA: NAD(P)-binding domain-containing protein [Methanothermobacter sp.]|nr:glycerol-3-phosphate dehydrogenase [NAD(P)+] [Methanothermobacter sp. MT-2]HHW05594.1 NAD(P)-binding domain-containing protein [Methanothermobacter sp.]HOK72694.1 NAD(P)-binding domain-containing protein [Methanothermobacter sp.]HOL68586.1 NAD(P)-binding domain-containing protein [Methanothermobacter sp.]HPQ04345.1 NAD(P)-binding domain-containing protein [Methanothermobacter sp.]